MVRISPFPVDRHHEAVDVEGVDAEVERHEVEGHALPWTHGDVWQVAVRVAVDVVHVMVGGKRRVPGVLKV